MFQRASITLLTKTKKRSLLAKLVLKNYTSIFIGKNLSRIRGKSLLAYTAEAAINSTLNRTILPTDCQEIAEEAKKLGIDVPFMRPTELAQDDTPTIPVLQDVVHRLETNGETYDAIFTLQPTNPLRIVDDIDGSIHELKHSDADSVISFTDVGERHPARMKTIDEQGYAIDPPFTEQFEGQRRQELETLYLRDGSVYLTRRDVLMNDGSLKGSKCLAWLIPRQRSCNIDEPFDIFLTEHLLTQNLDYFPGYPASQAEKH